jgi:hypothetical protein
MINYDVFLCLIRLLGEHRAVDALLLEGLFYELIKLSYFK